MKIKEGTLMALLFDMLNDKLVFVDFTGKKV
jgi:hypothetical protein